MAEAKHEYYLFENKADKENNLFFESNNLLILKIDQENSDLLKEDYKLLPTQMVESEKFSKALETLTLEDRKIAGVNQKLNWKVWIKR